MFNFGKNLLQWAPPVTLVLLLGPVLLGLFGTVASALSWQLGYAQGAGGFAPWQALLAAPGLAASLRLSITTGMISTLLALALTILVGASLQQRAPSVLLRRLLPPLLAVPHSAAALGLVFLLAPSGWLVRFLSPWATGWELPPDALIIGDPHGWAMVVALEIKEVPFLLLMLLAAQGQVDVQSRLMLAQSMGYSGIAAWMKTVLPLVYPQIRLPLYAVLAYSMTVVDVALIMGPTTPATLAVRITAWMQDPDLTLRAQAAVAALLQLALVAASLLLWIGGERVVSWLGKHWLESGARGRAEWCWRRLGQIALGAIAAAIALGLLGHALWSVAGLWVFPEVLPQSFSLQVWQRHGAAVTATLGTTIWLGFGVTALALILALACLEAEQRHGYRFATRSLMLLYLPLLLPQIVFLPGLQLFFGRVGLDGNPGAVLLAHLVFVLPYVFLTLASAYRAWDVRHLTIAATLGASPNRIFWRLRLPMLLAPVLAAAAVGFAVSVGQYLPTLLVGGGRIVTLTSEAVALAAGGDRRTIGLYALLQMALSWLPYILAMGLPHCLHRHRNGMRAMI